MSIKETAGWTACMTAKAAWVAEVANSGHGSKASQDKAKAYAAAMKVCTEQAGFTNVPWGKIS